VLVSRLITFIAINAEYLKSALNFLTLAIY